MSETDTSWDVWYKNEYLNSPVPPINNSWHWDCPLWQKYVYRKVDCVFPWRIVVLPTLMNPPATVYNFLPYMNGKGSSQYDTIEVGELWLKENLPPDGFASYIAERLLK